jgi:hypothetical protein
MSVYLEVTAGASLFLYYQAMLISVNEGFCLEEIRTLNARSGQTRYHKKSSRGWKSNKYLSKSNLIF